MTIDVDTTHCVSKADYETAYLLALEKLVRADRVEDHGDRVGHGCCMPDCNYDMSHGAVHTDECEAILAELDKLRR